MSLSCPSVSRKERTGASSGQFCRGGEKTKGHMSRFRIFTRLKNQNYRQGLLSDIERPIDIICLLRTKQGISIL